MGNPEPAQAAFTARDYGALVILAALAGGLMFYQLGRRYLWQDEAATAVLAERMLEFGRPLAYDGRNLITMDITLPADALGFERRIRDADAMVRYYAERGDFKDDTTWIGQPWGQFVLAAASLRAFGHGTWQARAPFALCGVVTVLVLYVFVRRRFDDPLLALLAALLLLANVYWVLHMRQCRYYAPASLFLLLSVIAYLRWQDARRAGAAVFVVTAWLWFQFDYGTFGPVVAILAIDSLLRRRRSVGASVGVFAALAAAVAPWVYYYELLSRVKETTVPYYVRSLCMYFYYNQYLFPVLLLPLAAWLLFRDRRTLAADRRQALEVTGTIVAGELLWVPLVVPAPHLRYFVAATPLACLLLAYVAVRLATIPAERIRWTHVRTSLASAIVAVVALTPWIPYLALVTYPERFWPVATIGHVFRSEWRTLYEDLQDRARDPNRDLIAVLAPRLRPEDEVLINYEDVPLMFYLPNRIRGGVASFRLVAPDAPPPRFAINNPSAYFLNSDSQTTTFAAVIDSYQTTELDTDIPSLRTGNCPDPMLHPAVCLPFGKLTVFEVDIDSDEPRRSADR